MKLSTEDIAKALGVSPINTNANLSLNNISIDSRDPQKIIFLSLSKESITMDMISLMMHLKKVQV